jgi:activator of HSP90 ATPase
MPESLKISIELPVSPERVYRAWLDSHEHSQFTGSPARVEGKEGGEYTAWDGYIQGKTLVMTPFSHIVQTWRTTEFPEDAPDSEIDLRLEPTCNGMMLTLNHTGIPDGQSRQYMQGWEDFYFRPMLAYFEAIVGDSVADMDG